MASLSTAQTAKLTSCVVLILSGNRFVAQMVRTMLFGLGVRDTVVAQTAKEADERLSLTRVDLIIADSGPTTYDPLPVLETLRASSDRRQAETPVILLTTPAAIPPAKKLAALSILSRIQKPLSNGPVTAAVYQAIFKTSEAIGAPAAVDKAAPALTLLLTENQYTAQVIRTLLLPLGLSDVTLARNPAEAAHHFEKAPVDFVIVDMGPASFDGLAVVEAVRQQHTELFAALPVLILAAAPSAALVERARAANITSLVTKPVDPQLFVDRVKRTLGGRFKAIAEIA